MQEKDYSEDTSKMIDEEVRNIIEDCYKKAKDLLTKNKAKLEKIALALLERESLDGAEVEEIITGKKKTPPAEPPVPPSDGTPVAAKTEVKKEPAKSRLKPSTSPKSDAGKA